MGTLLILKLVGIGLFVGIVSSMFGLGGGILITPLLPLITQIGHRETVGTALFCIFLVVGINSVSYWRQNLIDRKIALLYGGLASLGAVAAGFYSRYIPELFLKLFTGVLLVYIAVTLRSRSATQSKSQWLVLPMGFFAGSVSGLSGVGTGVLLGPLFLKNSIVPHKMVAPTLNAVLTITCFFGFLAYFYQGGSMVRFDLAAWIVVSALASAYWGRKLQDKMTERTRKNIMAILVLVLALMVLWPVLDRIRNLGVPNLD